MDVAGGRDGPWMWLGAEMAHGCGWGQRWPMDVAGGRDGPWMWLGAEMAHGCGWDRDGPFMWLGAGMALGCGWGQRWPMDVAGVRRWSTGMAGGRSVQTNDVRGMLQKSARRIGQ